MVAQVGKEIDPTLRKTDTVIDAMKARTPGWSKTLPPKRDVFGKEIRDETKIPFSPISTRVDKKDLVYETMNELFEENNYHPGLPQKKIRNIELTPEEHDKYTKMAGELAYDKLKTLVDKPWFQRLDNEKKMMRINEIIENARKIAGDKVVAEVRKNDEERYIKAKKKRR
jgi:hypothetical protein